MRCVTAALMLTAGLAMGGQAWAQGSASTAEYRPALASFWGDTGLWFVPTAEVLPTKGWSFSLYRTELDFNQGFSDVSFWPATFGVGIGNRLELFGALRTMTAIDRDTRPLFTGAVDTSDGGILNDNPFVRESFTGNDLGDLYFGGKVNVLSEQRNQPFALALRGTMKAPTGDSSSGAGSGAWDYFADAIVSKEINRRVEISGFGGFAMRGDPDDISLADSLRWGVGAAFGARSNLRLTTELHGESFLDDLVIASPALVTGEDGSLSPIVSDLESRVNAAVGLTFQARNGVAIGVGVNYRFGLDSRSEISSTTGDVSGDALGLELRLGFHRGVGIYSAPAPAPLPPPRVEEPAPAPPAPAPPPPPANRRPSIKAQCNPCSLGVGETATIRVDSQDPDGDTLAYAWGTPSGTVGDPRSAATTWKAETVPGPVTLNVTVDDGRGGTATDTVTIQVTARTTEEIVLDDVFFDLDQATLRPAARPILDRAVKTLTDNRALRAEIEGHTCDLGADDYNRTLGLRRATTVRDYLVSHGVDASRLRTVSYGEERPKAENSDEEHRRQNRRAILRIQEVVSQ